VRRDAALVQTVELNVPVLSIGRAPDNMLTLPDSLVSRHHAEVLVQPGGVLLTDLDSANGTSVGATKLLPHQPHPLADGTEFRIGSYVIAFQAEPHDEAADVGPPEAVHTYAEAAPPAAASAPRVPALLTLPRPTLSAPLPPSGASMYLTDLPAIFQDNAFLGRFLLLFEATWEPLEQRQDHLDMYFHPRTCPASFLAWLASWFDFAFNQQWPEPRRRRLLAEAMDLYRWRGTAYGLARMIEVCTGLLPEITEVPGQPFVLRVVIHPDATREIRELVDDLVREHKPAHAGYVLEFVAS
jgi:phage tail-like protein